MALIDCPNCNQKISDKAMVCPHCGVNLPRIMVESEKKILTCEECGSELPADASSCPNCGCPVSDQTPPLDSSKTIQSRTGSKRRKIALISVAAVLAVAIITVVTVTFTNRAEAARLAEEAAQEAEEYKTNLELISYTMLSGAVDAETAGNLIHDVWYNSIYEEYDSTTDKYTRKNNGTGSFYDDFNTALSNLFSDESFVSTIDLVNDNQTEVSDLMKQLTNPPAEFEEAYEAVKDYYSAYYDFTSLVVSPTGSLQTFTENFNDADSNVLKYFNVMKLYIDEG